MNNILNNNHNRNLSQRMSKQICNRPKIITIKNIKQKNNHSLKSNTMRLKLTLSSTKSNKINSINGIKLCRCYIKEKTNICNHNIINKSFQKTCNNMLFWHKKTLRNKQKHNKKKKICNKNKSTPQNGNSAVHHHNCQI